MFKTKSWGFVCFFGELVGLVCSSFTFSPRRKSWDVSARPQVFKTQINSSAVPVKSLLREQDFVLMLGTKPRALYRLSMRLTKYGPILLLTGEFRIMVSREWQTQTVLAGPPTETTLYQHELTIISHKQVSEVFTHGLHSDFRENWPKTTAQHHLHKPSSTPPCSARAVVLNRSRPPWEERPFHKSCLRPSENILILWFLTVTNSKL